MVVTIYYKNGTNEDWEFLDESSRKGFMDWFASDTTHSKVICDTRGNYLAPARDEIMKLFMPTAPEK